MNFAPLKLIASLIITGVAASAQGTPILYTFSSIGNGSLGTSSFNSAPFTITSTADTSQIVNLGSGIFEVPDLTATVFVSGIGSGTFSISTINVDNQNNSGVGFSDPNQNLAILFVDNAAAATYNLSTAIGPLSGPARFNAGAQFGTTAGNFSLSSVSTVTFQATLVPEPATFALAGLSGMSLLLFRRHRQ